MTRDTRIACFLMGELVAALRANDSDLFKRWLSELGGATWSPQADLQPAGDAPRGAEAKAHRYPLSDAQILQILDNLPQGEKHNRWRFAIQLCAVYGLR